MSTLELKDIAALRLFQFDRVLNNDPATHTITILGTFSKADNASTTDAPSPAIVRIETLALTADTAQNILSKSLKDIKLLGSNDIYTWLLAWLTPSDERPDLKIYIIHPATEVHIRKYSAQKFFIMHETPAMYEQIVKPYIDSFPKARTQWVVDILEGRFETEQILHREDVAEYGYVMLPDMKWDRTTLSSLYLVAISTSPTIRSLRDLHKCHIPMLRSIRKEAARVVQEKWGLERGSLRMYVHYQPSYYHFHVHIVNVEFQGLLGMSVGQAHLLDDVISILELDPDDGPSMFARMTLTYTLGEQHGLFDKMRAAQSDFVY
ncbi:scavenger mRNA decapping enzyme [Laetiporus sulphureus 93-53]|uniref:Scavenger mRNA decapping enzyme n=1 Tax=Laetiporus sulphureus 93-53 TaxID=1314785 RepID=A0A165IN47_9APHY|nr:scavenger mRNA decapping enzyme [Laetiporus sulphureus 93-53]KZT13309.1 scavenger mRNA decapping enzyme [Laetiporus sulphureus 93-53]